MPWYYKQNGHQWSQEQTGKDFSNTHLSDFWDFCLGNMEEEIPFLQAGRCSAKGSLSVNRIILQIMPLLHN